MLIIVARLRAAVLHEYRRDVLIDQWGNSAWSSGRLHPIWGWSSGRRTSVCASEKERYRIHRACAALPFLLCGSSKVLLQPRPLPHAHPPVREIMLSIGAINILYLAWFESWRGGGTPPWYQAQKLTAHAATSRPSWSARLVLLKPQKPCLSSRASSQQVGGGLFPFALSCSCYCESVPWLASSSRGSFLCFSVARGRHSCSLGRLPLGPREGVICTSISWELCPRSSSGVARPLSPVPRRLVSSLAAPFCAS